MPDICCCKFLHVTCIEVTPIAITLTIAPAALIPKERKLLCIGVPFPSVVSGTNPLVRVLNGGTCLPLLDCNGDVVRASSIGKCRQWLVTFGNDLIPHLTVLRGVKELRQCRCGDGYIPTQVITPQVSTQSNGNGHGHGDDD